MLRTNFYSSYNAQNRLLAFKSNEKNNIEQIKDCYRNSLDKLNCNFLCKNKKGHNVYKMPLPPTSEAIQKLSNLGIKNFFGRQAAADDFNNKAKNIKGLNVHYYNFEDTPNTIHFRPENEHRNHIRDILGRIDDADGDVAIFCINGNGNAAALSYAYLVFKKGKTPNEALDVILKAIRETNESNSLIEQLKDEEEETVKSHIKDFIESRNFH